MTIQFLNGKILFVDGKIAFDPACCCGGGGGPCQCGAYPTASFTGIPAPYDGLNTTYGQVNGSVTCAQQSTTMWLYDFECIVDAGGVTWNVQLLFFWHTDTFVWEYYATFSSSAGYVHFGTNPALTSENCPDGDAVTMNKDTDTCSPNWGSGPFTMSLHHQ